MRIWKQPHVTLTSLFTQEFCQKHVYKLKVITIFTQDKLCPTHFLVTTDYRLFLFLYAVIKGIYQFAVLWVCK